MYPKYVFKYALNTYSYTLKVRTFISIDLQDVNCTICAIHTPHNNRYN